MNKLVLVAVLMACPFAAAADPDATQVSAICGARSTCVIGKTYDGGKSAGGSALGVVEVHLGLKDKPGDAPDDGCRAGDKFDGGVEYWLIDGPAAPKQLLKLCNDGYGSRGRGRDHCRPQPPGL